MSSITLNGTTKAWDIDVPLNFRDLFAIRCVMDEYLKKHPNHELQEVREKIQQHFTELNNHLRIMDITEQVIELDDME